MTAFSKYLRDLRGKRTIAEVERETEIDHGSISRAERGERLLRYWTLYRLCDYYGADAQHAIKLMGEARIEREQEKVGKRWPTP